jgi:ribosomal subunit interface protein
MDTEIQARGVAMQPTWRALIEQSVDKLSSRFPEILRLHVTLKHERHHLRGFEEADIVATVEGATLRAAKQEEDMVAAIHAAFDSIERELGAHHAGRRHFEKAPGGRSSGAIARLFPGRSYGFIRVEGGEEVYFHRNSLHELDFASLTVGFPVELEIEVGKKGRQASRVFPVGERAAT